MGQGEGSGKGGGLCPGILWAILWFLILWFLAWPVAFFIAWLYVLLIPFSACIEPMKGVCEAILKVLQLPLTCAENMIAMKPLCGGQKDRSSLEIRPRGLLQNFVCATVMNTIVFFFIKICYYHTCVSKKVNGLML